MKYECKVVPLSGHDTTYAQHEREAYCTRMYTDGWRLVTIVYVTPLFIYYWERLLPSAGPHV